MIYIFIYKINRRSIIDWRVRDSVDTFFNFSFNFSIFFIYMQIRKRETNLLLNVIYFIFFLKKIKIKSLRFY